MSHKEGEVPPEASLIRLARQAKGLSPESAAALLPIRLSGNRWRQIEKGYERRTPFKAVRAPDGTLAHMAHAVGVSPERLENADRPAAAAILREIIRSESEAEAAPAPLSSRELEALAEMVASAAAGLSLTSDQLAAAYARAQQLIEERRRDSGGERHGHSDRAS